MSDGVASNKLNDRIMKNEAFLVASILEHPHLFRQLNIGPDTVTHPLCKKIIAHKIIYPDSDLDGLMLDREYPDAEINMINKWITSGSTDNPIQLNVVCERIQAYAIRKQALRSLKKAQDEIESGADVQKTIASVREATIAMDSSTYRTANEVALSVRKQIERVRQNGVSEIYVKTGFPSFDHEYVGLERKCCHIMAGRPSMGKTAFTMQLAEQVAIDGVVASHTLEMDGESLALRSFSRRSSRDIRALRTGLIDPGHIERACQEYSRLNLFIDDSPTQSLSHIEASAYRLHQEQGRIDLMVVDYLGLMDHNTGDDEALHAQIGATTKGLRRLAKELNFALLILSQLNRGLESRADKRPLSSDLRGSGEIEQDADSIMMLYRPCVYDDEEPSHKFELISTKQRNGHVGTIKTIDFDPSTASFIDKRDVRVPASESFQGVDHV